MSFGYGQGKNVRLLTDGSGGQGPVLLDLADRIHASRPTASDRPRKGNREMHRSTFSLSHHQPESSDCKTTYGNVNLKNCHCFE